MRDDNRGKVVFRTVKASVKDYRNTRIISKIIVINLCAVIVYYRKLNLAFYSLNSYKDCMTYGPGRPRFEIDEDTLLHFRTQNFPWKGIARLLLVSR